MNGMHDSHPCSVHPILDKAKCCANGPPDAVSNATPPAESPTNVRSTQFQYWYNRAAKSQEEEELGYSFKVS
uniref:Uncharacterized protein n=1 Tax=Romanomermis culicivorax TaxID=13658 RepID=A0A915IAK3_ROMCU